MSSQEDPTGAAREFGDLYDRYHGKLVRYCRRRLDSAADAEDAAQEALLRAFQAWSRFDATTDAWPWLATIAARVCADARRRAARPLVETAHESSADVHEQAATRLRAAIVEDALGHLPPRYRNPLVLKEFAGWSYREIAELDGRSVAAVRSTIMRGRRQLSAQVEAVARTQGQWPLPAAVPHLVAEVRTRARRGHAVRTWVERAAQTLVAAFGPGVVTGVLTPPSTQAWVPQAGVAVVAVLAAVGVAAPSGATPPAPVPPAAAVPAVAVRTGAPGNDAQVSADVAPSVSGEVPDIRTVAHIDDLVPENPVVGIKEIDVTAEYHQDHMTVRVSNFYTLPVGGDTDEPYATELRCRTSTEQAACEATKQVVAAVGED